MVSIHYVGKLDDGTVFDSSRARKEPFKFKLGEGSVIDGWEMLVGTMALKERSILYIPPEYGYGDAGYPGIVPPNANLRFDVELMDIGTPIEGMQEPTQSLADDDDDSGMGIIKEAPFWDKDPDREQGMGPGYVWEVSGSGNEVIVKLPLPKDLKLKEIDIDVRTFSIKCVLRGKEIIRGDLFAEVKMDDSHWDLEKKGESPSLIISLAKLDKSQKWKTLLKKGEMKEALEVEVL